MKKNVDLNFDYLRLVLAATVMLGHINIPLQNYAKFWMGYYAVFFFFCISGYLITLSYLKSDNLQDYLVKRVKIIYPPIIVVIVIMLIFGKITSQSEGWLISTSYLLLFQDWSPLNTLDPANSLYTHGAFWTLVIEFQFYLILPIIIFYLKKRDNSKIHILSYLMALFLAIFYFLSIKMYTIQKTPEMLTAWRQNIIIHANFFIAGIVCAFFYEKLQKYWILLGLVGVLIFWQAIYYNNEIAYKLLALGIMFLVLSIARICGYLGKKAVFGDMSYGIYIYHFPVITILTHYNLSNPKNVVIFTTILSFISWHLIEKNAIYKKNN